MDVEQIRRLKPMLTRFLKRFDDCFARKDTRAHMPVYVEGQLSELEKKNVEMIAKRARVPVRTLQEFLSLLKWDDDRMRDRVQEIVVAEHSGKHTIGIIDETSFVKKGDKTPGVQRQHCGTVGKQENCMVTVHLAYAVENFHCLLDGELFLPESWSEDRQRCEEAGIPDDMVYRPKWQIALELYDDACRRGVSFEWLVFDEGYGGKPPFLRALDGRRQRFIGEVPKTFTGWIDPPRVTERPFRRHRRGRPRKTPRLVAGSRPAQGVEHLLKHHPALRDQSWKPYRIKDGEKGPMVWEVKHTLLYGKDEQGMPGNPYHLLVGRNVLKPDEIKFFISNAPPKTKVETLLLVGFSRWRVERCFQDQKSELGLDAYEGRRYPGLKRHLVLTSVSHLFLARVHHELREKKSGVNGLPGPHRRRRARAIMVA
jgi:SRSO17 transposase